MYSTYDQYQEQGGPLTGALTGLKGPWLNTKTTWCEKPLPLQEGDPEDERTGCHPKVVAGRMPAD